jgi:preprotein translocase subunit SecE
MRKLVAYFHDVQEEMRKVTWPSRKETINYSILVIVISVVIALFFGLLDFLFNLGIEQLISP